MTRDQQACIIDGSQVADIPGGFKARPHGDEDGQSGRELALQAPRLTDADALAHDKPEVEAAAMNQEALQDVVVSTQMRTSHSPRLIEMRKRSLGELRSAPPQASAAGAPYTAAISIDRGLRARR